MFTELDEKKLIDLSDEDFKHTVQDSIDRTESVNKMLSNILQDMFERRKVKQKK